ncbi:hypothetical protein D5I55_00755 [Chakrabartia godavariana]|nr:hypothetical protein D5I55_00755 [Chakrabartia godavariana]
MPKTMFRYAAGLTLALALPAVATAQTAKQCLTPKEAQSLITFALPDVITSVGAKCAPAIGPEAYLAKAGPDLAARYRTAAAPNWPTAKQALLKFVDMDAALLANLPDEALKGFFGAGVATAIVKQVDAAQCADIDRIMKTLAPLPPENMSQLVGIMLEIGARPKAQAAAAKAKAPFSICPASSGSGKPVTTK